MDSWVMMTNRMRWGKSSLVCNPLGCFTRIYPLMLGAGSLVVFGLSLYSFLSLSSVVLHCCVVQDTTIYCKLGTIFHSDTVMFKF